MATYGVVTHRADVLAVQRTTRFLTLAVFAALAGLRLLLALHYRIDSDEPQHMHIVWGWVHGFVQYRDVFDNHSPLFHIICTPLLRWIGDRAEALVWLRLAMVPLFFFSLWCIYRLGCRIQSPEVGLWGAVFAALTPALGFTSTEFRADDLWAAFWFWSLVVLVGGRPSFLRGFAAGLLVGATAATSLKTLALVGCLGAAAIVGLILPGNEEQPVGGVRRCARAFATRQPWLLLLGISLGFCVVPGLLALVLAKLSALDDALRGIFTYNASERLGRFRTQRDHIAGILEFVAALAILVPTSGWMARRLIAPTQRYRFHLVFLGSGFYGALIYSLWPLLDAEHLIPCHPLIALSLTPLLLHLMQRACPVGCGCVSRWPRAIRLALLALVIIAGEALSETKNRVAPKIQTYRELLRLSEPTDFVMDLKGETIFRQRAYYYLFEGIGIAKARHHQLPDTIPEQMIATHTCITVANNYRFVFPRAISFMNDNFITVGEFRVLGSAMIRIDEKFVFEVVIPETFAFVSGRRTVNGILDGHACDGFATLPPGRHEFMPAQVRQRVDFVWKRAVDRGFMPTHPLNEQLRLYQRRPNITPIPPAFHIPG